MSLFESRLQSLRTRMAAAGLDVALITDDDNVYYLTGYYDYLHMEFGRPTILVVPQSGPSLLITRMGALPGGVLKPLTCRSSNSL